MAHSVDWTTVLGGFEAKPDGGESKRQGDDRIRELKVALRERLEVGHVFADADANKTYDGRHAVKGGAFTIYKADKTTAALTVTDAGVALGAGVDLLRPDGATRLLKRQRVMGWTIPGTLFTRSTGVKLTDGLMPLELPLDTLPDGTTYPTVELVSVRAMLLIPPNGASGSDYVDIDILRCPAGSDPEDGNFESILSTPLRLARGVMKAQTSAFMVGATAARNDIFVPTVVAVASGAAPSGTANAGSGLVVELIFAA